MGDLYENRDVALIVVVSVFTALSLFGLVARVVSQRLKHMSLLVDDWLLVTAWFLCAAQGVLVIWAALCAGLGHHAAVVTSEQIQLLGKKVFTAEFLQPTTLALSKTSVLILLHRIFVTRAFQITCKVLGAIVVAWWLALELSFIFTCWPVESRWNPDVKGVCYHELVANIAGPIPWIVTDIAILVAPLPVIRKLHMPLRQKVALGGLFLIGILTCVASIARYRTGFFTYDDATYYLADPAIWNIVEANITVFCACLVASKPVAMILVPDRLLSNITSFLQRRLSTFRTADEKTTPVGITSEGGTEAVTERNTSKSTIGAKSMQVKQVDSV